MSIIADPETCNHCGGRNVVWSAPSPLWNLVMRHNDINGEPLHHDLVCIPCFVQIAGDAGIEGVWRVAVDPEPKGLIKVTPSGRVWDEKANLWREPELGQEAS